MLEFILDGQSVTEPEGLRDVSHRIYYNDGLNGYLEQFDGTITFYGSEYRYLRDRFFTDGCAVVPVEVVNGADRWLGNIFLNDADWQPALNKVECEIVDRSFLSLIDNNKDIKAYLNVPRSKNDVDISAFTVVQTDLQFKAYDTVNNTDTPANRHGIRVYDALKMLVAFMSDGLITFESNFFLPDDDPAIDRPRIPTLLTGRAIRTGVDDSFPFISFQELYSDLNKLYNLSFSVEETANGIVLRIEPKAYFRASGQTLSIPNALEIRQSADESSFYANVKYGSAKEDEYVFFPGGASPPSLPFVQWSQEEFHLGGQCNKATSLDLQLKTLITDTNVIMRCLPFGSGNPQSIVNPADDSYDKDVFLVLFDSNNITITSTNPLDTDVIYYNGRLTNNEVANRWGDGIPFPIFLFLGGNTNNDARGYVDSSVTLDAKGTVPNALIPFMIDNGFFTALSAVMEFPVRTAPNGFDPSTNMADGTLATNFNATWYQAPLTTIYNIETSLIYDGDMRGFVIIQVRAGALVQTSEPFYNAPDTIQYINRMASGSMTAVAAAGDRFYVVCFLGGAASYSPPIPPFPPVLKQGSFMEVRAQGNQITKTYNPADNWLLTTETTYPIPRDWWRQFRNDWHQRIQLTYGNGQAFGYVKDIKRPIYSGDAEVSIVSKFADVTR